jgi:AcrR family transcriptional regulator
MSRNAEKNEQVREARRQQILDAALTTYIRFGFHGTDMDMVAKEAGLAKGLLYYYYKTKKELFRELFTVMFEKSYALSNDIVIQSEGLNPVERLVYYCYHMFLINEENPRVLQFNIRVPFDAYAVFGAEGFNEGAQKSKLHKEALANLISEGITQKLIPDTNPDQAANSFWSVFVANAFEYAKLMEGNQNLLENRVQIVRNVVQFCFQGLGIQYDRWNDYLEQLVATSINRQGAKNHEGL